MGGLLEENSVWQDMLEGNGDPTQICQAIRPFMKPLGLIDQFRSSTFEQHFIRLGQCTQPLPG